MIISSPKQFNRPPQRIVSLVPSQTELLSYFGLDKEVKGITKFCVHPHEWFTTKQRIGGTKNVNIRFIKQLQPDLIIANIEENVKDQVEELARDFDVWITDVNNLDDACAMIKDIGELTHKTSAADSLVAQIKTNFGQLQTRLTGRHKIPAAYLIWREPYMTVGGDTFINDMMKYCGLQNVFENKTRYPEISLQQLNGSFPGGMPACELVLLSSEPYPFQQKHIDELQEKLPGKKIRLVDGEMFSWYGSRLLKAPSYFKTILETIG